MFELCGIAQGREDKKKVEIERAKRHSGPKPLCLLLCLKYTAKTPHKGECPVIGVGRLSNQSFQKSHPSYTIKVVRSVELCGICLFFL